MPIKTSIKSEPSPETGFLQVFESTYISHYNKILYYCEQYLNDGEEARNVAQETFMEIWNRQESVDTSQNLLPLLLTIARNKCLNILRSRKVRRRYESQLEEKHSRADYDALADTSAEALITSELTENIEEIIGRMPEKTREIFLLSRRENLSYEKISQKSGISLKMVEYRIMQALKILRVSLKEYINN